jgi:hypothetical protein
VVVSKQVQARAKTRISMTADLPTLAAATSPFCLSHTAGQLGKQSAQT